MDPFNVPGRPKGRVISLKAENVRIGDYIYKESARRFYKVTGIAHITRNTIDIYLEDGRLTKVSSWRIGPLGARAWVIKGE